MQGSTALTPGRAHRIELDVPDIQLTRAKTGFARTADRVGRSKTPGAGDTQNVVLVAGSAWILQPLYEDWTRLITSAVATALIAEADVNLASGFTTAEMWKSPTDLTGVTVGAGVQLSGVRAFIKRVGASASWNSALSADATAFPAPTLPSAHVPMDRVLQGKVAYPANKGFAFGFYLPHSSAGYDTIATLYFGGESDNDPPEIVAGEFALAIRGGGQALLYERENATWKLRHEFVWADPLRAGSGMHIISVAPYDRDRIRFRTAGFDTIMPLSTAAGPISFASTNTTRAQSSLYRHDPAKTEFNKLINMTGPGIIRVDLRRDLRMPFWVAKLDHPTTGSLVDAPDAIHQYLAENTPIRLRMDAWTPTGSSIAATLYDTENDTQLATNANGDFLSLKGHRKVYAVFDFQGDGDVSPALYSYRVWVEPAAAIRSPTLSTLSARRYSVTGPDIEPSQETASFSIEDDQQDAISILRQRGRIPVKITTLYDDALPTTRSVIFQGEVAKARAVRRGKSNRGAGFSNLGGTLVFPSPTYHTYDCDCVGMWARLNDQISTGYGWYWKDDDAPADPQAANNKPAWKLTDILKDLLKRAGYSDAQIDVPDNPIRHWGNLQNQEHEIFMQPGQNLAEFAVRISRDYLGQVLLWDANAGANGMWRLLANPQSPYTSRFTFYTGAPAAGKFITMGAYGSNSAPVLNYEQYIKPPEANLIVVQGAGGALSSELGPRKMVAVMVNRKSYDPDPSNPRADTTHIDYIGREVPLFYADNTLITQSAVRFVCRRLYDIAAHGERWFRWQAPLGLITVADDEYQQQARPLRINDAITFVRPGYSDITILLRSVNPDVASDRAQLAWYEGIERS